MIAPSDIKRQLGIGHGTLADKERDYQARPVAKAPPKPKMEMIMGVWHIYDDGATWPRPATATEIMSSGVCVTILDNDAPN